MNPDCSRLRPTNSVNQRNPACTYIPSSTLADHYLPVVKYVPPEEFVELGAAAKSLGFSQVASGPLVRSSYHAREMVEAF